jgi:hypothetical protein
VSSEVVNWELYAARRYVRNNPPSHSVVLTSASTSCGGLAKSDITWINAPMTTTANFSILEATDRDYYEVMRAIAESATAAQSVHIIAGDPVPSDP